VMSFAFVPMAKAAIGMANFAMLARAASGF
jgi:hypothetical protein